jgi:hypothetical protein
MKKWLLFLPIVLVLAACAPTEAQIQAAHPTIELTSTPVLTDGKTGNLTDPPITCP